MRLGQKGMKGTQDEMWKFFDNYQTRLFTGDWTTPAGKLTADHLQKARQVLDNNFDVVRRLSARKCSLTSV